MDVGSPGVSSSKILLHKPAHNHAEISGAISWYAWRATVQAAQILAAGHSKNANARDDAGRIVDLHIGANRATINPAAVAFSPYAAICKAASLNPRDPAHSRHVESAGRSGTEPSAV